MENKIREANQSLQEMKHKEVETTKKLSILQNFQLNMELDSHSSKIEALIKQNKTLQDQMREVFVYIDSYKDLEGQFVSRIESQKAKAERLERSLRQLDEQVKVMTDTQERIDDMLQKSEQQLQNFLNKKVGFFMFDMINRTGRHLQYTRILILKYN